MHRMTIRMTIVEDTYKRRMERWSFPTLHLVPHREVLNNQRQYNTQHTTWIEGKLQFSIFVLFEFNPTIVVARCIKEKYEKHHSWKLNIDLTK